MSNAEVSLNNLKNNTYPGRGIVLGKSSDGSCLLQVYWIMGRSENSRNRIFVRENDTIKTVPFDESKVEDPSLIIYNAIRTVTVNGIVYHVVSNGDQTDTIVDYLEPGDTI